MFRFEGPLEVGGDAPTGVKALQLDASGNLKVAVTGAGSGGTSSVDESSFSAGTTAGTPAMGVYQASPAALTDGQLGIVELDANRNLKVNVVAGSAGNPAASPTGSAVPADADYQGVNVGGTLRGRTAVNPSGSVYAAQTDLSSVAGTIVATGHGTAAGSIRVELPTDGTGVIASVGSITNALPAGTNLLGQVSASNETSTIYNGTTSLTPSFATISTSTSGPSSLVSLVSSKKIRVLALSLMSNGTVNVKFQSHTTPTDLTGLYYLAANTGFVLPYNPVGWFQTNTGEQLDINLSGSTAVGGCLTYVAV